MQRLYRLRWNVIGFLLLTVSQVNYAQDLFSSHGNMSEKNPGSLLPTPSTMSNDAFRTRVSSQNAEIQSSLQQEVKNEAAHLANARHNRQLLMQPTENRDVTTTQTSITPAQAQPTTGEDTEAESQPTYTEHPSPSSHQQAPLQNDTPSKSQGGWQIQY